ncbi:PD-(D/E)XK nuclease-like domain-containing protein [Phenylobacterium sp. J426]|uniref:PD-(D/E)XK nuclease-like domain-containing protein n=1 Tax=Phenylobacterium sp. J426 TaxID=2898439 RepID=UPI0021507AB7|nr:PD-(D/E)XK nuclease-like domain-containing protein [Phenylobacterium sp. J426]MCR5875122.1 PD-(D/E)XK nuclease-like domain-containing protein [Phenylobacterium sp. J426]
MITLQDGVYIGLDADRYFAADRLGSTDLTVLHNRPADWFYGSRHNPYRPERETSEEMAFGSALHVLLLEGEEAYRKSVAIKPATYVDAKTGEVKPWNGNSGVCKAWLEQHDRPGVTIISEDADRRVRHMAELIRNHPELGPPMQAGLSEVSVLWTNDQGVKLRARFDKLLPRFVVDLKTFGGDAKGRTITDQCLSLVAQRHMDVQRFLYFQARQKMRELIEAGRLVGGKPQEREWITKVAAVEDWKWCWIFYRRRDDARGYAPIVKPILRSHFDTSFESGRQKVEVALANYRTFVNRFGLDVPWAVIEPAEEPTDHSFPPWLTDVAEPFTFPEHKDAA